jgi:hypothetical protein
MFKKICFIILSITVVLSATTFHLKEQEASIFNKFQEFMAKENKKYSTIEEFKLRFSIFKKNFIEISKFNL